MNVILAFIAFLLVSLYFYSNRKKSKNTVVLSQKNTEFTQETEPVKITTTPNKNKPNQELAQLFDYMSFVEAKGGNYSPITYRLIEISRSKETLNLDLIIKSLKLLSEKHPELVEFVSEPSLNPDPKTIIAKIKTRIDSSHHVILEKIVLRAKTMVS